jgi:hypothetical protein
MMASIQKPPAAAIAPLYDKTLKSGNLKSLIANIRACLAAYKGATKGGPARRPGYGTRQAAKVAGGK